MFVVGLFKNSIDCEKNILMTKQNREEAAELLGSSLAPQTMTLGSPTATAEARVTRDPGQIPRTVYAATLSLSDRVANLDFGNFEKKLCRVINVIEPTIQAHIPTFQEISCTIF